MRGKVSNFVAIGLSVFLMIIVIFSKHWSLICFPISIAIIGAARLKFEGKSYSGPAVGIIAMGSIAIAGAFTGALGNLKGPLGDFSFATLFFGVTVPFGLACGNDIRIFLKWKAEGKFPQSFQEFGKKLDFLSMGIVILLIWAVFQEGKYGLVFFPLGIILILIARIWWKPQVLGFVAMWAIGGAGALAGISIDLATGFKAIGEFGFLYLFICTTIPLGLMGMDEYLLYKKKKREAEKE